ncbi:oligosaccharide flippase family protein [Colwellia sp. E2M01]|uniref:oligosaccharide flippase family protein n=1 Tax=Colwellia sp. E2M01 TaxID=2841561 RepID=UPI001C093A28|nr:oligosaccharide flippase family protein [Colwellia sp. E2M01]MBU2869093.1 oligosaccharide flippase family protein [Colwellia sp. E2M01]
MSLAIKTLSSSLISLVIKFFERGLGLISTLVLARILTPSDFGIVAIITIFIYLFETISSAGTEQYIIQKKYVSNDDLNSAWTLDIILRTLLSIIFFCCGPLLANFYELKEITYVCWVISPWLLISALNNPGLFLLKKKQNYIPIMKLAIIQKSISVALVIIMAFIWKNYWAMIVGLLLSAILKCIGSYVINEYRPKVTLVKIKEQWNFSKWILSKGIIGYSRAQADNFIISAFQGVTAIGIYHTFKYVATMPAAQVLGPASEPLLASFAEDSHDRDKLRHKFKLAVLTLALLALPITMFMYSFSAEIVYVLLGEQWMKHESVFKAFSLLFLAFILGGISSQILIVVGQLKPLFLYNVLTLLGTVALLLFYRNESFELMANYRSLFEIIATLTLLLYCCFILRCSIRSFFILILPLCISNYAVYLAVSTLINMMSLPSIFILIFGFLLYSFFYFCCLFISYQLYYKKTSEGVHLAYILKPIVIKLFKKTTIKNHIEKT